MSKPKIVVTQDMYFTKKDTARLEALGNITFHDTFAKNGEEWMERVKDANVILSGKSGLKEKIYELKDVFISVPFVGTGWMNLELLKKNNVTIANAPGCNSHAVSEWIVGMILNLIREFPKYINMTGSPSSEDKTTLGLNGRKIVILGKGNIGERVGNICKQFDMNLDFFTRNDDLHKKVKDTLIVVNTLSSNPSSHGLLDKKFFQAMKKGSYFITVTSKKVYDIDALIEALETNHLAGAASDAGSVIPNDSTDPYYLRLQKHPKVLATPHIAARTEAADQIGNDIMVRNVEEWAKGNPINIVT